MAGNQILAILQSFFVYAIQIQRKFVSLHRFQNKAEAQRWKLRDGKLYILKSASNLNDNLNCSKELEHYAS